MSSSLSVTFVERKVYVTLKEKPNDIFKRLVDELDITLNQNVNNKLESFFSGSFPFKLDFFLFTHKQIVGFTSVYTQSMKKKRKTL